MGTIKSYEITNAIVVEAIAAIDSGRIADLVDLIDEHPWLLSNRLHNHEEGYFKNPYLLWFVADNPIRINKLPDNIVEITAELIKAIKRESPDTYQDQVDYTIALVASGRIPQECGVQIQLIDLLIDAGAAPNGAMAALAHGNLEAAQHLIDRGGSRTLALAVCLGHTDDFNTLIITASASEKTTALAAAAFYGNEAKVKRLLEMNVDANGYPDAGSRFHNHATPLHQAVASGSLACVKLLVEAGARLDAKDKMYDGTPLDWADYLGSDEEYEAKKGEFALIEDYLQSL